MTTKTSMACAMVLLTYGALFGEDYYVSTNGLHDVGGVVRGTYVTDDGVSHDAYTSLQEAITANLKSGNIIWVEDGFVCETGEASAKDGAPSRIVTGYLGGVDSLVIRSRSGKWETGAEIRGRHQSDEEPCGPDSVRCISANGGVKYVGFRLVGGSTTGNGGGVCGDQYGVTLENCLVENCVAKGSGGGVYKKDIRDYESVMSVRMVKCVVRNNRALGGNGGGAYAAHMISCQLYGNSCEGTTWNTGDGGGLSVYGDYVRDYVMIVSNCAFYGNSALNPKQVTSATRAAGCGGGLSLHNFRAKVYECVFSNNTATAWGGGAELASVAETYNSVFVDNTSTGQSGGGVYGGVHYGALVARNKAMSAGGVFAHSGAGQHAQLVNCTVTDNSITGSTEPHEAGYVALTNSVVWSDKAGKLAVVSGVRGAGHSCWPEATEGEDGNTAQNPKLVSKDGKAYVAASVYCSGRGVKFDWMTDGADIRSKDWYGDSRILGDGPDMGWVSQKSSAGGVVCLSADFGPSMGLAGSFFSLTARVDNARSGAIYDYHWTLTDLEGVERRFASTEAVFDQKIDDPGDYEVSLVVSNRADSSDSDFGVGPSRLLVLPLTNYVTSAAGATPVSPYARPETAATSINDAMALTLSGSTVILDAGTHPVCSTISLPTNVTVRGAGREATVLKAAASGYRLVSLSCADAMMSDLTLTGGSYGEHAGCVEIVRGRLVNCAVVGNKMIASNRRGLVQCSSGEALIDRCVIASNEVASTTYGWGTVEGVVYVTAGTIRNTLICDNLIWDVNTEGKGIGHVVCLDGGNSWMESCTVVDNVDRCQDGCAVYMKGSYQNTPHLYNTVLSGNAAPKVAISEGSPLPNLRATGASYYYDIMNCFFVGSAAFDAMSFVGADAKFCDAASGDYRLKCDSPCRNKGLNRDWMANASDVYGQQRVRGRRVDIGAAETKSGLTLIVH